MTKIDWSGELEAYHEDGRVAPVKCFGLSETGKQFIRMELIGGNFTMMQAGLDGYIGNGWSVRNRQPSTNARLARLEDFVARVASGAMPQDHAEVEAKALVAEIAPVDPDLIEARKIVSDTLESGDWHKPETNNRTPTQFRNGDGDESGLIRRIVEALRQARKEGRAS